MNIFFTSDLHFGHGNIIRYSDRPFKNADHMNEMLVKNWNMRVKPDDVVYHLGDFCCYGRERGIEGKRIKAEEWEKELNGNIIHIRGNHDNNNSVRHAMEFGVLVFGGRYWFLTHRPPWQIQYPVPDICDTVVCGHVHERWHTEKWNDKWVINVGVDKNKFMPVKKQELIQLRDKL